MLTFTIAGTVREAETQVGLSGLFIKAYDKDLVFDDLLGTASTGAHGEFTIVSAPEDFRDFFETKPDIYLKVYAPDATTLLYTSERAVRWNAGPFERFEVHIPRDVLGRHGPSRELILVGDDGRLRTHFEVGEPLTVRATGMGAAQVHEIRLCDDQGRTLFTERVMSDRRGTIAPTVLWPQFGLDDPHAARVFSVEEAQARWCNRRLTVRVAHDKHVLLEQAFLVPESFQLPLVLSTDVRGVVRNGFEAGEDVVIVSGYNMPVGTTLRVYMVRGQHHWRVGDAFAPVRLASGREAMVDVDPDPQTGCFRVRLARTKEVVPGAYDFIVRAVRYGYEDDEDLVLREADVVGHRTLTGLVVREGFMASKFASGGCVNLQRISGRKLNGPPYFQYTDVFPVGAEVWGALDPTALDPNHQSKMCALYVVPHKTAAQWSTDPSLQHLAVLGGNPAVLTFKTQTGCVNANARLLWPSATAGDYDVIADFGNNATDAATFVPDATLTPPLDLVDGYVVAGFRVVPDPTTHTTFSHAGTFEYNDGPVTVTDDAGMFDPYKGQSGATTSWTVPQKAMVYFPADAAGATTPAEISTAQASYPLFVVVHGNSSALTSYQGYNYLLEHFARNGFIAASIHLEPNMGARGRAEMLLQHIVALKTRFGATLANNIGIMGHSRGGEAVVKAARMNHQLGLGHQIKAVISLAPTDHYGRETLGGAWATPYVVVYGSMDGDVAGGLFGTNPAPAKTGFSLYDRATGAPKSHIFVYGSTHGRYNTVWGDTDITAGWSSLGPSDLAKLITPDAHHTIAKGFMLAFCRRHQLNETQWDGIFTGEWVPPAVAAADSGNVHLYVQSQAPTLVDIDSFEGMHSASSWQTSTAGAFVDDGGTLPVDPSEDQLHKVDTHSPHDTGGLLLRWDGTMDKLWFDIPTAQKDMTAYSALSLRITQKVDSVANPAGAVQDLYVTLTDTIGHSRSIRVSKFAEVPPPHTRHYHTYTKSALCTVRIPLHAYTIKVVGTQEVDIANLQRLTFDFGINATGEIAIDSVDFTN